MADMKETVNDDAANNQLPGESDDIETLAPTVVTQASQPEETETKTEEISQVKENSASVIDSEKSEETVISNSSSSQPDTIQPNEESIESTTMSEETVQQDSPPEESNAAAETVEEINCNADAEKIVEDEEELDKERTPVPEVSSSPPEESQETQFEDVGKINVPDPSIIDSDLLTEASPTSDLEQNESMIEGAWADILGSGQLKKKVVKAGKPSSRPVTNEVVTINISGKLSNGQLVDTYTNFKFQLGDLEVIQGLDLIVALMDIGEISQAEIGPRFAYGSMGNGKDILPDSTILYTIELVTKEKERDLEEYTLEERLKTGNLKRERGNYWYSRSDYPSSIQCYRRALEYLDTENETETDCPDKLQEVLDDRLKVYNNMGAAQMKIEAYEAALKSVEHVLRCQKDNVKAIYRKAKILTELGKITEAIGLLERALHFDPSSKIFQQDLMRLQAKQKSDVAKERSLYKKMFQLNDTPIPTTSNDKPKLKLTVPWTLMIGAVTAVVASYVTYRYKLF